MSKPPDPPRRLPGDLFSIEDRREYEEFQDRFNTRAVVPLSTVRDLTTRIIRNLRYRYIPGRDRYADGIWLIARELNAIQEIEAYYSCQWPVYAVRREDRRQIGLFDLDKAA